MTQYYRHFRNGQLYRLLTFATIEATGEEAANFFEEVMHDGKCITLNYIFTPRLKLRGVVV